MRDLGCIRLDFTWTNGRNGEECVWERVDRVLANDQWKILFLQVKVYHKFLSYSDHSLIVITIAN